MRQLLLIGIFFSLLAIPFFTAAQDYEQRKVKGRTFYVLNAALVDDTLSPPPSGLPNGLYMVYWPDDELRYELRTRDGKIDGQFEAYTPDGRLHAIGSYKDDADWTFREDYFLNADSTYKVGAWQYYITLETGLKEVKQRIYNINKLPLDEKGRPADAWRFDNGRIMEERAYAKDGAIVERIRYFEDGKKASREVIDYEKNLQGTIRWNSAGEKVFEQFTKIRR